jgi:hypothetical protein
MTTSKLIYLISSLHHLVDHGFAATIAEVEDHIDGGNLFAWLSRRFAYHIDLSIIGRDSEQERPSLRATMRRRGLAAPICLDHALCGQREILNTRQIEARTGDPGLKSLILSPRLAHIIHRHPRLELDQRGERHDGAVAFAQAVQDDPNRFASGEQTLAEAHAKSGEGKR